MSETYSACRDSATVQCRLRPCGIVRPFDTARSPAAPTIVSVSLPSSITPTEHDSKPASSPSIRSVPSTSSVKLRTTVNSVASRARKPSALSARGGSEPGPSVIVAPHPVAAPDTPLNRGPPGSLGRGEGHRMLPSCLIPLSTRCAPGGGQLDTRVTAGSPNERVPAPCWRQILLVFTAPDRSATYRLRLFVKGLHRRAFTILPRARVVHKFGQD